MLHLQKGAACPRLLSTILLFTAIPFSPFIHGQSLYISSGGQTGTSGTNWTTSGTNPVTISVSGTANINTSVITGYLNSGISVIVNNSTVGTVVNSDISKTAGASATLTIKDVGNVKVAANISSVSNALDLVLWADTDNSQGGAVEDYMFVTAGVTISTNGGKIIMAGGPDNGTNGGTSGDGIPDGFAWNGSNSSNYGANTVGGLTLGPLSGTGTVVSLLSGGGEIILRGATSNNNTYPGIGSQANLKIVSGAGKITIYGKSSSGHGIELTYGSSPNVAISSASTSTPAIDIKGTTTASGLFGFWASNNGWGNFFVESSAATGGGISIEGVSSLSYGIIFGVSGTNMITQLLSQSGTISLKGDGSSNSSLFMYGDVWLGNRKDANAVQGITPSVTASTANILIQADDQYTLSNTSGKNVNIYATGSLTTEAYTAGYGGTLSWTGNLALGSNFSSIVLGESAENYTITLNNSLTATGNITAYASDFNLSNGIGLTSTGAGNITINARGSFNTVGTTRRSIVTANGNINVYADADANGNGQLDIDYLTFNPGAGTTTLRAETFAWSTSGSVDKPYFNGTGAMVIEPADAGFQAISTSWFLFDQDANGIGGITIGKNGNNNTVLNDQTLTVAGPVRFYGTTVTISGTINTSSGGTSGDIYVKASADILLSASYAVISNGGDIVFWADADGTDGGRVELLSNIGTGGGHFWVGGGASSETQNGLSVPTGYAQSLTMDKQGVLVKGNSIHTNGGTLRIKGESNDSGDGTKDVGVMLINTSLQTGAGNLSLYGTVKNDLSTGSGLWIGTEIGASGVTGNVTISSTSGNIYLEGISAATNSFVWAHGLALVTYFGDVISISSTTGQISSLGDAVTSAALSGEALGWVIQNGATNSYTSISTDGGAITISGNSANAGDDIALGLRAANIANSIVIGDANSGDVTLKFGALQTTTQSTVGVTALGGTGALVLEPYGTDWAGNFTLSDEYAVRSTVSSLRIGKGTITKIVTTEIALSISGATSIYGSFISLNQNLASTTSGNISLYTNFLLISSSRTISSEGALIIEPLTNGSTIGIAGGTGSLAIAADYFVNKFSDGFSEIRIGNSAAGAITLGGSLTLKDPLQLISAGNLVLNDNIILGANDFTFNGAAIAPATGKYIQSNGTGKVKMTIGNSAAKTFPIGTSYYNPVRITNNTGASDLFYATVSDGVYYNGAATGSVLLGAPRVDLTWNIGNSGGTTCAGNVDLAFNWVPANNVTGTFVSPKLMHYNGTRWDMLAGTPVFNLVTGTLSYTGYTGSFSPFAIGESNFILPVTWLSFTGRREGKTVKLNWSTATESDNDHFEIERSSNETSYQPICQQPAAQNPAARNDYQFTDASPVDGAAYYRIKQVDKDGQARYSSVIRVAATEDSRFSMRSIGNGRQIALTIPSSVTGKTEIIITDLLGRQLLQQTGKAGEQLINLPVANAVYIVTVINNGKQIYSGKLF